MEYPIVITERDGTVIDRTATVDSAFSVLYGDLSTHSGASRRIVVPRGPDWDFVADVMQIEAELNADAFGIPTDIIVRGDN